MNDNALDVGSGSPPGTVSGSPPGGILNWRAAGPVLRSTGQVFRDYGRVPGRCFSSVVDDLLTTIFPSDCRACRGPLLRANTSSRFLPLCDACLSRLQPQSMTLATGLCRSCGEALGMESDRFAARSPVEGLLCTPCRMIAPPFTRAVAYGVYENQLREMLHLLKYDRMEIVAKPLGEKLAQAVLQLEHEPEWTGTALVVSVPLFRANQRTRGFNQSALLAEEAIGSLRRLRPGWRLTPANGLLLRVKATESQFNLSSKGRRRNLVGAFKAADDANVMLGRDVLLIDDIYTTGATSRACAQVLRRAGAARVWVATLARAQREQVALWGASRDDPD